MKRLIAIIIYIINENDNNYENFYSIISNNNNNNDNDNIDSEFAPLVNRLIAMLSSFAINHYMLFMDRAAFMQKREHEQFPPKSYQIGKFFHTPYSNHFGQRGLPRTDQ